ncbi:hypothetical protein [Kitasatospora sp. NPDC057738]|uniref:hypothetical protein n=1 Tax=Kitasatospora sp. NPDC057738 TaxID=3346233 RepID=UPI0036C4D80F
MNEVIFRAKDLIRPAGIAALVLALVLETAFGLFALTDLGTVLLVAMTLALALPFLLVALRAWTGVGAEGITVNRGFGPGRTYSWQQISWVEVRRYPAGDSYSYALRIHLTNGRSRLLPGLGTDKYHSTTEFLANTRQVMDRWERNTAPDRRVEPRPRPRLWDVLSVPVIGLALGAAFVAVVLTQLR